MYSDLVFEEGKFKGKSQKEVAEEISEMQFIPVAITNTSGYVYHPHTHPETKLLAFLQGTMEVTADNTVYTCKEGDLLIIPGDMVHLAVVGKGGCKFFWSEKIL